MSHTRHPRRKVLVHYPFQLRFVRQWLLVSLAVSCVVTITVCYFFLVRWTAPRVYHAAWSEEFGHGLLIMLLVTLVGLIVAGVLQSHRLAGPLFRLRAVLRRIGSGDLSPCVRFRRRDQLHDLADEINVCLAGLRERATENRRRATQLGDDLTALADRIRSEPLTDREKLSIVLTGLAEKARQMTDLFLVGDTPENNNPS